MPSPCFNEDGEPMMTHSQSVTEFWIDDQNDHDYAYENGCDEDE
jgi:hypothetical protein